MTREEIDKVEKEIREHCRNNNCRNCDIQTIYGCIFLSSINLSKYTEMRRNKNECI